MAVQSRMSSFVLLVVAVQSRMASFVLLVMAVQSRMSSLLVQKRASEREPPAPPEDPLLTSTFVIFGILAWPRCWGTCRWMRGQVRAPTELIGVPVEEGGKLVVEGKVTADKLHKPNEPKAVTRRRQQPHLGRLTRGSGVELRRRMLGRCLHCMAMHL